MKCDLQLVTKHRDLYVVRCARAGCGRDYASRWPPERVHLVCRVPGEPLAMPACRFGPGWHLAQALDALGFRETIECGCNSKATQMNRWGPAGCRERLEEITGWLREAAEQAGVTIVETAIRDLVVAAIDQAERTS